MIGWLRRPQNRVKAAWWLFWGSIVAWPLTSLTIFASEPQGVLGLSWFAVMLNALNIVVTTDVRDNQ